MSRNGGAYTMPNEHLPQPLAQALLRAASESDGVNIDWLVGAADDFRPVDREPSVE